MYLTTQCPAVNTQSAAINDPPHNCNDPVAIRPIIDTCHGNCWFLAGFPFIIRIVPADAVDAL